MSKTNIAILTASLLSIGASLAIAAETSPSAGAPEGKGRLAACRPALDQLCGNVEKGGGRKIKCLKENESKLTPECKTALDAAIAARAERQAARDAGAASTPAAPAPAQK